MEIKSTGQRHLSDEWVEKEDVGLGIKRNYRKSTMTHRRSIMMSLEHTWEMLQEEGPCAQGGGVAGFALNRFSSVRFSCSGRVVESPRIPQSQEFG